MTAAPARPFGMLRRRLAAGPASLALAALAACGDGPPEGAPVGIAFASYADAQRPRWDGPGARPVEVTFWYPAAAGSRQEEWRVAFFRPGPGAFSAPLPDSPRRFPLVLLSHGTGGSAVSLGWLARGLAARGHVVAAVNHHGNSGAEPAYLPQGFALWWERAQDFHVVLEKVAAHPLLGERIDLGRVGAAGFSLGGYTALLLAGARTDRQRWQVFCQAHPHDPNCLLPPEAPVRIEQVRQLLEGDPGARRSLERAGQSYRAPQVRAALALAPVQAPALEPASLAAIDVPVLLVAGTRDDQAPIERNAAVLATSIPGARLERIPGGTHYMFLSRCAWWGWLAAAPLCSDPSGVDRAAVHDRVATEVARFFAATLGTPP